MRHQPKKGVPLKKLDSRIKNKESLCIHTIAAMTPFHQTNKKSELNDGALHMYV